MSDQLRALHLFERAEKISEEAHTVFEEGGSVRLVDAHVIGALGAIKAEIVALRGDIRELIHETKEARNVP